jgi:hypothetical protein
MALKYYFYILMLLFFLSIFGAFMAFGPNTMLIAGAGRIVEFLLFAILGYKCFGPAVQG